MATPTSSPVNAGHAYANEADDCEDREQWDKAATAHSLAAEQFQKAIVFAQDPEAVKTLRLLVMNHSRKAKTLFLKAAKANEPQSSIRGSDNSSTSSQPTSISSSATPNNSKMQSTNDRLSNLAIHKSNGYHDRIPSNTYSTSHQSHLLGSQAIDDSYALLNDQNDDDSDPFNKFWNAVETLVQKLSNPVAFASVPLNEEDNPKALMEDTNIYATQQGDLSKLPIQHQIEASMMESFFVVQPQTPSTPKIIIDDSNNTTASEMPIPSKTIEEYAIENKHLKNTVDKLSRQVSYWKKAADEGNVLKSSILQFRNDVQKQAKRIMQSQESMKSSMINGQYGAASVLSKSSKPNEGTSATSNPQARIKELEDEVMALRVEYNRQKDLMSKYKERWEKLKESAKKRRAQPNQNEEQTTDPKSALRLEENSRAIQPPPRDGRERTLLRTLAQQSSSNQHVVQSVQTSLPPFASLASSPSRLRFEHKDNSDEEV
ncbi:hypothetical protein K450DRAFT_228256 [Umbelopsis ramanniana AG]|uniref:Uncharacterized protein n=1 Tax=Umbelopsis ramanniana AG TaxID=1314678 RepID=A0AAD5HHK3_UMBRA|nr:uncharacterized protein K450DRAFT_228256 [Umbelopsis ramanniana AG]KAI8582288.1 hypothetical protein K450DRAFT_228256 [Umbelopsis ramanniana AG]